MYYLTDNTKVLIDAFFLLRDALRALDQWRATDPDNEQGFTVIDDWERIGWESEAPAADHPGEYRAQTGEELPALLRRQAGPSVDIPIEVKVVTDPTELPEFLRRDNEDPCR